MDLFILRVRLQSPQSHKDTGKLYFRFRVLLRGLLRLLLLLLILLLLLDFIGGWQPAFRCLYRHLLDWSVEHEMVRT